MRSTALTTVTTVSSVELGQEVSNVLSVKSSVTATINTVYPYYSLVRPPPCCIGVDMEKQGYFSYCQHRPYSVVIYHILLHLLFN